jgi:hypothetical protein
VLVARRPQVDFCMLCGSLHSGDCASEQPPEKPKKRLAVVATQTAPRPAPPKKKALTVSLSEEDMLLNAAIRSIASAGLLSDSDRDKYRHIISVEPSAEERSIVWRARRRLNGEVQGEG